MRQTACLAFKPVDGNGALLVVQVGCQLYRVSLWVGRDCLWQDVSVYTIQIEWNRTGSVCIAELLCTVLSYRLMESATKNAIYFLSFQKRQHYMYPLR